MLLNVSFNETCTMIGPGGGIGRHAGLKIQWPSRPYGFKSRPGYIKGDIRKVCLLFIFHVQLKGLGGLVAKISLINSSTKSFAGLA